MRWHTLILLILFTLSAPGLARDFIVEHAWLEDSSKTMALEDVRQQTFTPFAGLLSRGYRDAHLWVRLRIDPDARTDGSHRLEEDKLVLRIRPAYLDEIELFDPLAGPGLGRLTGDRYPPAADEYRSLNFNFVIPRGDTPRDIWLRLNTSSTNLMHVEALPLEDALAADNRQAIFLGIYLGLILLTLAWSALAWITSREALMGIFTLKQAVALLYSLAYLGFFRLLFSDKVPPGTIDALTSLLVVSFSSISAWFDYRFLGEFSPPRIGRRILLLLVFWFPTGLLFMILGFSSEARHMNMIGVSLEALTTLYLAISARAWHQDNEREKPLIPRWLLIGTYGLTALSLLIGSLPALGVIRGIEYSLTGFLAHALLSGIIMLAVLQFRTHAREKRRSTALHQLALAEKEIDKEREHRREQEQFLAMLTHELKTPLAVLRMVLGSPVPSDRQISNARQAIGDMDALIERCMQADRLSGGRAIPDKQPLSLTAMLRETCTRHPQAERLFIHAEKDVVLTTDLQMLHIILGNLIDNAAKYSPADSPVHIHLGEADGIACIRVDNLPGDAGLPDPEKVFEKYYRSSKAKRQTGSGLGLFLASRLARMLGGTLDFVADNSRIRFTLCLPN